MSSMFRTAGFNMPIPNWNVSKVTNMSNMFNGSYAQRGFGQDIGGWNVSNVENMSDMFTFNWEFNHPIGNWNVGKVTNMSGMFSSANKFNQYIGNWDVSKVTNFSFMFYNQTDRYAFNQNISGWNTGSATTMEQMFTSAFPFAQDLGSWNIGKCTTLYGMFQNTAIGNMNLSNWDIRNVKNMGALFSNTSFNSPSIIGWDVSNVTIMTGMFGGNRSFNQNISGWNVSNVTMFTGMFQETIFNQPIGNWNVSNSTELFRMFQNNRVFNQDITGWNVGKVRAMTEMFSGATKFNQNLGSWNVTGLTNNYPNGGYGMFNDCGISAENMSLTLYGWSQQNVQNWVNIGGDNVYYTSPLGTQGYNTLVNTYGWNIYGMSPSPMQLTFVTPTSNCTTCMFLGINSPVTINWGDGNQTTLSNSGYTTHTYSTSGSYTVKVSGANVNAIYQFGNGYNDQPYYLNYLTAVNSWGLYNITSLPGAFQRCSTNITALPPLPASVTSISNMFFYTSGTIPDITGWNTSNVTNMSGAFYGSRINQNISVWNTSNVTSMNQMFWADNSFNQNLGSWNVTSLYQGSYQQYMFTGTNMSTANIDATLWGWSQQAVKTGITIDFSLYNGQAYYGSDASGLAGYNILAGTYGWQLNGLSLNPIQLTFTIPSTGSKTITIYMGINSAVTVNWGDGGQSTMQTNASSISYTYATPGSYSVSISGANANAVYRFGDGQGVCRNLTAVNSWGGYNLTSLGYAFQNLTTLTSIPTLPSTVTNIDGLFYYFSGTIPDITGWNTSNVTSMLSTFEGTSFNQNIGVWNTSNLSFAYRTFTGATAFNQSLGNWNVKKLSNCSYMLSSCGMSIANFNDTLYKWSLQSPLTPNASIGADGLNYGPPL
jgi:surface protein